MKLKNLQISSNQCFTGKGCEDAITISFSRYMPTGEIVAVKKTDLDNYPFDVSVLQVRERFKHKEHLSEWVFHIPFSSEGH